MTDEEFGRELYISFWNRNGGYEKAPAWEDQAGAIMSMWVNIAISAKELFAISARELLIDAPV